METNILAEKIKALKATQINEYVQTRKILKKKSKKELISTIIALTTIIKEQK